jgi:hypothetical protein
MRRPSPTLSLPAIAVCAALAAAPAYASSMSSVSPIAIDGSALALAAPAVDYALAADVAPTLVPEIEAVHYMPGRWRGQPRNGAVWYHPRPEERDTTTSHGPKIRSGFDLYGGAYALKGQTTPTHSDFGFRGGPLLSNQVQVGLAFDWLYRHDSQRTIAGAPFQEAGTTITPERLLAQSSSHLFPMSAYLQIKLPLGLIAPYAGVAGGYEILYLTAQDYETGHRYNATFGGWGWQAWAGAKIPLGGPVKLLGELFLNESIVQRDVQDIYGQRYQERVDVTGGGLRAGLGFGF